MRRMSHGYVRAAGLWAIGFLAFPAAADTPRPPSAPIDSAIGLLGPPNTADLDVTFIERTPRYDYDAAKNNPAPGDAVTFSGHIRNTGTTTVSPEYRWDLDDVPVAGGTLSSMAPGQERVVSCPWTWQSGNHRIRLTIDPNNLIAETSEQNNSIEDRTNGVIVGFWVEQSVYNYFRLYQSSLPGIGSVSWEDWAQRQMRFWNQFCENAIYPTTPQGVLDRVRIDKIVIVPDGALPLNGGLPTNHPDLSDKTVDLMWGFPASLLSGGMYNDHTSVSMSNPFYYEGSLLHELGHARYLIDTYGLDVHNTVACCGGYDSVQIYEGSTYVGGSAYMPYIAFGEVLYYNKYAKMMSGGYDQGWSEYDAGALNRIAGQRATCGNYNAPCNIGVFLQDLPANNHVRFTDSYGRPRPGADIRVYRATGGPGWYGKTFDNTPDLFFTADTDGYAHMPRNPFSSGAIQNTYGIANGVMILRIAHSGQVWYRFQEVTDFNIQYWRGNTQDAYYTVGVPGPNSNYRTDFDKDGDVDLGDFGQFQACFNGPNRPPAKSNCDDADLDGDGDVDVADFGAFQDCFNGPNRPPACL